MFAIQHVFAMLNKYTDTPGDTPPVMPNGTLT